MANESKAPKFTKKELLQKQMLLEDGLVEIYDPIKDAMCQVDLETAKRLATVRPDIKEIIDALGIK